MEAVLTANRLETPNQPLFPEDIQFSDVYTRHFLCQRA